MAEMVIQENEPALHQAVAAQRKIRVVYMINSLRDGGAERQLLELLRHHNRDRFDVSLILMDGENANKATNLVTDVFNMDVPSDHNSNWLPRSLCYLQAMRRTKDYLRRKQPDILHAYLPGPGILGGITALFVDIPIFMRSPRSLLHLYSSRTRIGTWLDQIFLRRADFTLGNSDAVSKELIDVAKCHPQKCSTIYNGVDLDRFHPRLSGAWRTTVGWDTSHVVFGLVGNFSPAKRHHDFVEAAALITEKHPEARFVMVGRDYGSKPDVLQQIGIRGLSSKLRVIDVVPEPEHLFAAFDVYVCTSESEGFSNVLLEAMACGKPIIATDAGGNAEAVVHNETGFIVPVGSPGAISDAAQMLICDPNLRRLMGARGRARAEEKFSLQAMVRQTEALYLRLAQAA